MKKQYETPNVDVRIFTIVNVLIPSQEEGTINDGWFEVTNGKLF